MRRYYPVFLDLEGKPAVVVGDGREAQDRADALRAVGADVRVIRGKDFSPADLVGAALAIACGNRSANEAVRVAATTHRVLLNVIDVPELCDWIHGSVIRRGPLTIAISTAGAAPALAVRLKEKIGADLGAEYGRFLEIAAEQRAPIAATGLSFEARRELWYRIADSEILDALRAGDEAAAREVFAREIARAIRAAKPATKG